MTDMFYLIQDQRRPGLKRLGAGIFDR